MSHRPESPAAEVVLFDLDGVLVDSQLAISGCINHALAVEGFAERSAERLHRFIGAPLAAAFAELTAEPLESAVVRSCVARYRERYAEVSVRDTSVVSGIPEVLGELYGRFRLAVATSKPGLFAEPLLEGVGLRGFFELVVGSDPDATVETKATTIGAALRLLGAGSAVMVGDRQFDVLGAHANGLPCIGVTWGAGSRQELAAAQAEAIVEHPRMLPPAIAGLLRVRAGATG
ncbi:MAG: HAD hydrolase-like protein [Thermoleophilaceae bacterium]